MAEEIDVVVIGAGQAGLATSHELAQRGVEHVVLEASVPGLVVARPVGQLHARRAQPHGAAARARAYDGDDPGGFMSAHRDRRAPPGVCRPARSGARGSRRAQPHAEQPRRVRPAPPTARRSAAGSSSSRPAPTSDRTCRRRSTVSPPDVPCVDSSATATRSACPTAPVLVVGSGQSACQIAEELALSGRDVVMACGRAPWFPRRLGGRDLFEWLLDCRSSSRRPTQLADPRGAARAPTSRRAGAGGGHDLHYRTLPRWACASWGTSSASSTATRRVRA